MERKIKITKTAKDAFKDKEFTLDEIKGIIVSDGTGCGSEIFYFEKGYDEQCILMGENIKMSLTETLSHLKQLIG